MPLFPTKFEKEVKKSFLRVKEEINLLKITLKNQNELLSSVLKRLDILEREMKVISPSFSKTCFNLTPFFNVPQEVKGSTHSLTHSASTHSLNNQSDIKDFKQELEKKFSNLQSRKLYAFIVIYELEEERDFVTYFDIADKMGITPDCVRTYVSSMINKGIPILKKRINNKVTCLSILPEFRSLSLKKRLDDLYYNKDPTQRRLFDNY